MFVLHEPNINKPAPKYHIITSAYDIPSYQILQLTITTIYLHAG